MAGLIVIDADALGMESIVGGEHHSRHGGTERAVLVARNYVDSQGTPLPSPRC